MNFAGLQKQFSNFKNSSIVILPVPFEKSSTYKKGSVKGPNAIIEASQNMELYDIETDSEVYRKGIWTHPEIEIKSLSPVDMIENVSRKVLNLLKDDKFVVVLGGEHTVSIGVIKAVGEFFNDITVLHLDAHTDMRDTYLQNKYSHACTMARVKEIVPDIVSVGIRSIASSELKKIDKDKIFYAREIHSSSDWIKKVIGKLSKNVFLNIDIDVFDPSVMPSVGTPEPGGLNWYQVLELIKSVSVERNIVSFDVVELCPHLENVASDFLAAKLIYKTLSYIFRC